MRKILLLFGLALSAYSGIGQINLPIDFESTAVSTGDFVDFDGGTATVLANPQKTGINLSDSVAQIVRNGGQIWAGSKITLASNLDFSTLNSISMKVYTTAPVGTTVKFKLEGSGAPTEVDVATTVSGAWETLTWNFNGQPNTFNTLVFMFDFGNVGDGTATSTFLFDDIEQVSGNLLPTLPITFDSTVTKTGNFVNFDGGTGTVIANPQKTGINLSDSVGRIVRNGGQIWAGSKITLNSNLDFSSLNLITMKVYTTAPIGTTVKFKLEGSGAPTELDVTTTVTGAWETLTWDFNGAASTFNTLVFMFDFGNVGDGTATSTFLFDDIAQDSGAAAPPGPPLPDLPIDFDSSDVSTAHFTDFDGGTGTVIANPQSGGINTSDSVGQIVRNGGQTWAGSKIQLASNLDFSTLGAITMKVYTDAPVGTLAKLKLEGSGAPVEVDVNTTVSGGWETLLWDFSGQPSTFNTLVFMFDFGNLGDGSATSTYLIDDIMQDTVPTPLPPDTLPIDFESSVNLMNTKNAVVAHIANPNSAGINTSATVGKLTRPAGGAGNEDAGAKIVLHPNIDFSVNPVISMKVYTTEAIGHKITIRFEGGTAVEKDAVTTVSGAWETVYWDFSGEVGGTNNEMLLQFNNGTLGSGEEYYFDDIQQIMSIPAPIPDPLLLPIDFDTVGTTADFENLDGGEASVIFNTQKTGINTSDSVASLIRNGGEIWAGASITLDSVLDFSQEPYISMKVYTEAPIGTTLRLRLHSASGNTDVDVLTTVSGEWEKLYWNFTGQPKEFDKLNFMFDFGNVGDGSATSTFLIDDIMQEVNGPEGITNTNLSDVVVFPNPTNRDWNIYLPESLHVWMELFNAQGALVESSGEFIGSKASIDASKLPKGIYFMKISSSSNVGLIKLVKE